MSGQDDPERGELDPHTILAVAGGPVDEARVTLAIYGERLEPDDITDALGISPTSSHLMGERRSAAGRPFAKGAWLFTVEGGEADGPEEVTERLLRRVPDDEDLWRDLAARYDVQLRYGIHFEGWNRGFDLSPGLIRRIAALRATLCFDIYAYGEESDA